MADRDHLILTATGPDQVGLVEKISAFITHRGCNIEDSKMAVFYGEFAVIVLISGDSRSLAVVAGGYREIESETGLSIAIKTPSSRKAIFRFRSRHCASYSGRNRTAASGSPPFPERAIGSLAACMCWMLR